MNIYLIFMMLFQIWNEYFGAALQNSIMYFCAIIIIAVRCTLKFYGESLCYNYYGAPHLVQKYATENQTRAEHQNICSRKRYHEITKVHRTEIINIARSLYRPIISPSISSASTGIPAVRSTGSLSVIR
jgi:hypothetical protein